MNHLHLHCTFVLVIVLGDDHVACEIQVHAFEKKNAGSIMEILYLALSNPEVPHA